MTENEIKKLLEKFQEMSRKDEKRKISSSFVYSVDLGTVILEVAMGIN